MTVIFHVVFALVSLSWSTYAAWNPTIDLLRISGMLMGATAASGIALGLEDGMNMTRTCVMGSLYFLYLGVMTYRAVHKLAKPSDVKMF